MLLLNAVEMKEFILHISKRGHSGRNTWIFWSVSHSSCVIRNLVQFSTFHTFFPSQQASVGNQEPYFTPVIERILLLNDVSCYLEFFMSCWFCVGFINQAVRRETALLLAEAFIFR